MRVTRIFSGDDGRSHFEDLDVPLDSAPGDNQISDTVPLTGVMFRYAVSGSKLDYHTAPRRQFVVTLRGSVEVGCGDGTVRVFGPGDVLLADDLTGQGHTGTQLGEEGRWSLILVLAEDADISAWRTIDEPSHSTS